MINLSDILNEINFDPQKPCERCSWLMAGYHDRIGNHILCSACIEAIASGTGKVLQVATIKVRCTVCLHDGTVPYFTFSKNSQKEVKILGLSLCSEHFQDYIARRLTPEAFHQIAKMLVVADLTPEDVFLLHHAFYDAYGHALHPVETQI